MALSSEGGVFGRSPTTGRGPVIGVASPGNTLIGDLFGEFFDPGSRRRRVPAGFKADPNNTGVFEQLPDVIQDLLDRDTLFPFEQQIQDLLLGQGQGLLPQGSVFRQGQDVLGRSIPFAEDLAATGFPTDPTEAFDLARQQFFQNVPAEIAEIAGSRGSGFQNILAREAQNFFTDQAQAQIGLDESAAGRRAQTINQGVLAQLGQAQAAFPLNFFSDLLSTGNTIRGIESQPGQEFVNQGLSFLNRPSPQLLQTGFPVNDAGTDASAAFAESLPALLDLFSNEQGTVSSVGLPGSQTAGGFGNIFTGSQGISGNTGSTAFGGFGSGFSNIGAVGRQQRSSDLEGLRSLFG